MPRVTKPSTKARRRKECQFRKNCVLAAAEATFLEDGYQSATTEKIADRAGVSVGTVYNTCGSKEKAYVLVAGSVGQDLVAYIEQAVLPIPDPDMAIEYLIRFRLANFERHRLLLILFSSERGLGDYPNLWAVSDGPKDLYYRYLDLIARIFEKGMTRGVFERMHPLHLALSFEGVLNAFVGYWMSPEREDHVGEQVRRIKGTFMKMAGLKRTADLSLPQGEDSRPREVFVTSFDMLRLKELIAVARAFGSEENAAHLDGLEDELLNCKVVEPAAVPRDVITMNSRMKLTCRASGESLVRTLVFPLDADKAGGNLSVLSPLGTVLLGRRVGTVVETDSMDPHFCYEITELLYQPEGAGDFHR